MSPSIYKEFVFDSFIGGYSSDIDPEMLPKSYLSQGNNIQYNKAVISKRDGRQLMSSGPTAVTSFTGQLNGLYVFQLSNGTSRLLALSTSHLYVFNNATSWTDITPPGGLHGSVTFAPQFITYNDVVYITNGSDPIIHWDNIASAATFTMGAGAPDSCYSIIVFAGFFHCIRPTISGTSFGWRDMWSDFNNPLVFNSGQAGAVDLNDSPEQVSTAAVVGRWMTIYKQSSLYNVVFVGAPVFFDYRRINQPGLTARRSLVEIPMLGLESLGHDDYYIFDQNNARPIGKPIRQETITNINWAAIDTMFSWVRPDIGRVYHHLPFNGSPTPNKALAYSYIDGQWMPEGDYMALAGTWAEFSNPLLVSQMTNAIQSYNLTIDQLRQQNQRQALTTDGEVVFQHFPAASDFDDELNNVPINSSLSTAKVMLEQENGVPIPCAVYEIIVTANNVAGACNVTLQSSVGDNVYAVYGPYPVSFTQSTVQHISVEAYGERFMAQIANNNLNESFQIKQIALRYRERRGRV